MSYLAHKDFNREQTVYDHLTGTAKHAESFANPFGAGNFAKIVALFHDIGKYSDNFQKRINGSKIQVDHSTAGAKLLYEYNKNGLGFIAAYCIAGHHGGLPDGGSRSQPCEGELHARLKKDVEDFSASLLELKPERALLNEPGTSITSGFQVSFFIRMIYSCLVDADWLDTEEFFLGKKPRGLFEIIPALWDRYSRELTNFSHPKSELNLFRTEILNNCLDSAEREPGLFTLTAPTGSGKTISSMAFALKHAVEQNKRRVIYIVPYNTIIEQNAEVFERILGAENILQHHSNVTYSSDENSPEYKKLLATENWDASIIITSSVRFFESLFSNRPSDCRKLHNIANSVLIFDEAQMIPLPYLIPCVNAIKELVLNYRCTAILATATQSSLDKFFNPIEINEIVARPKFMYEAFKRVNFDLSLGNLSINDLADKLSRHSQVLCIVNTRRIAQILATKIEGAIHLSTTMYPLHRSIVLNSIRGKLDNGTPCIVISTSLIEAGVDVDFPVVYREKAGLDSIIQAAGRCNRESKRSRDNAFVFVFETETKANRSIAQNISAYEHVARQTEDISSLEAIELYFEQLRYIIGKEALDQKSVVQKFNDGVNEAFSLPFESVAKSFHLIEENTKTIYVLVKSPKLAEKLRNGERSRQIFRELQKYAVSIYRSDYKKLEHQFEYVDEEFSLLTIPGMYHETIGIQLDDPNGFGLFC